MSIGAKTRAAGRWLRSFRFDNSGAVAMIFALAILPVMLTLGATIDYQRATMARSRLQAAVDSAAITVAEQPSLTQTARNTLAQNIVKRNLGGLAMELSSLTITETEPTTTSFIVTATGSVSTAFMQLMLVPQMNISATAASMMSSISTTTTTPGPGLGCVLSLDHSEVDSVDDMGNATIILTNCDLYDNSNNGVALNVGGNASLSARYVGVYGGVSGASAITTTAGLNPYDGIIISDPYAGVPLPKFSGCNQTNFSAKTAVTISPGVYCGGMQLNAKAAVTMNPGVYILDQGSLTANGQASMTGTGVTIVFTSSTGNNWATASINGGATINLTAPTCATYDATLCPMPGIVLYGDQNMTVGTSFKLNGGSSQVFGGAVYLPRAALNFIGNAASSGNATPSNGCLQVIADTIYFSGTSNVAVNCGAYPGMVAFGNPTTTTTTYQMPTLTH
jgi:Flp pilus assembly protein TadG